MIGNTSRVTSTLLPSASVAVRWMRYQTLAEASPVVGATNDPLDAPLNGINKRMGMRVVVEDDLPGQACRGNVAVLGVRGTAGEVIVSGLRGIWCRRAGRLITGTGGCRSGAVVSATSSIQTLPRSVPKLKLKSALASVVVGVNEKLYCCQVVVIEKVLSKYTG